jgi:hypothetical protein
MGLSFFQGFPIPEVDLPSLEFLNRIVLKYQNMPDLKN